MKIKSIYAYEVIDSRGFPTVAAIVTTDNNGYGKAMVPSGASTGEKEAVELRDGDAKRFMGKGVLKAVKNVNTIIAKKLIGMDASNQKALDEEMIKLDGTPNKGKLGANAILAVSIAAAKAAALELNKPFYEYLHDDLGGLKGKTEYNLPVPMLNVINGGAHADNTIDFQEFMFLPVGAKSFHEAVRMASECFHSLQKILKTRGDNTNKGDEGGFAPNLKNAEEALDLMIEAIKAAGYKASKTEIGIAMDAAASEFYDKASGNYVFKKALKAGILTKEEATKTTEQMITYWENLINKYPIISLEDALDENDWEGFAKMQAKLGNVIQTVGDDIYCTNPALCQKGIDLKASNSILIKLNQIGTLTETIQTIKKAQNAGWTTVVSHRSGETEDTTIADLSVGLNTMQIKTGSMSRSERVSKYNRLIEIELEKGDNIKFPGLKAFNFKK